MDPLTIDLVNRRSSNSGNASLDLLTIFPKFPPEGLALTSLSFNQLSMCSKRSMIFLNQTYLRLLPSSSKIMSKSPGGLTKSLPDFIFVHVSGSRMPKDATDWPTVDDDMVKQNQRLMKLLKVLLTSGITWWRINTSLTKMMCLCCYVVDGNDGLKDGSCSNRNESSPLDTKSRSLVLQNYFGTNPNLTQACADNSSPLIEMVTTCDEAAGKRWPNFIAVDFYQVILEKSDGGGAAEAVDEVNGRVTCGCDSLVLCKSNVPFGTCDAPAPKAAPTPVAGGESSRNPRRDLPGGDAGSTAIGFSSLVIISAATLLLW
ncbi:unnamed protein product [Thlaspi arvense]|uniref:Uncharacterized protein n=1 Tax=Thlaspi arvense TaxID=13288 RepID=A0AAU9S0K4_THLAR|nr:unnamed protein product [Thlaspi arvense]